MYYDNQAAMYITNNHIFHEQTKHIEVDYHSIRDMMMTHWIVISFVTSSCQLGDFSLKSYLERVFNFV